MNYQIVVSEKVTGETFVAYTPVALVVGGEGRGVRPLVRRNCDLEGRIPMLGRVGSLNASAAAAVALYEAARQRRRSRAETPGE